MRYTRIVLLGVVATMLAVGCSDDDDNQIQAPAPQLLAEVEFAASGGISSVQDHLVASLLVGPLEAPLFSVPLDNADENQTITINASNNSEFADAVAILVNGTDDVVARHVEIGGGSGTNSSPESVYFQGGITGSFDPDFAGAEITHVRLILDQISLVSPGSNPGGNGIWTDYDLDFRVQIMGRP